MSTGSPFLQQRVVGLFGPVLHILAQVRARLQNWRPCLSNGRTAVLTTVGLDVSSELSHLSGNRKPSCRTARQPRCPSAAIRWPRRQVQRHQD